MKLPECIKRKRVDGIDMCYAIGCCVVGDMACECEDCFKKNGYRCPLPCKKANESYGEK